MRTTDSWRIQHDFHSKENEKFLYLYHDWIFPHTYESLAKNKIVLDAGSGPGIQTRLFAQYARKVYAVDLEAIEVTKKNTKDIKQKISYKKEDLTTMDLKMKFDVVNCVGVIHHTRNPKKTFENLTKHTKKDGIVILWVYSREGNFLMSHLVEPLRKLFLERASHNTLLNLSLLLNLFLYPIVNSIYRLPFNFLPYYEYFQNYRKMNFKRNSLNIYDKLNAPEQYFLSKKELLEWFENKFYNVQYSSYKGVSWRISGQLK